jgi:hypothetical protein
MSRAQSQKGGAGSQQIQVAGNLILGITEERATEIAAEQARLAINEFAAEGIITAKRRVENFDEKLVNELSRRDLLDAFSDPAFQILLRKAQVAAATTSDDADHELLSKLLAERALHPTKTMHLIITRSAEVIEYLDQDALLGVTLLFFVYGIIPSWPDPKEALAQWDNMASALTCRPLPTGVGWLNRLSILNAINYQSGFSRINWDIIIFENRPGYVTQGLLAEEAEVIAARLRAIDPELESLVVPHAFSPGRSRVNIGHSSLLIESLRADLEGSGKLPELEQILKDARVDISENGAIENMFNYIKSDLPHLDAIRTWANDLKGIIQLTPVGRAIGYSNGRRFIPLDGLGSLEDVIGS